MSQNIDELVKNLRAAADELDTLKNSNSPEVVKHIVENPSGLMSCCGTCTGVSAIPPCQNACIKVSPLM
ncbi:hypothetical protein [Clostridium felsineum]|uniref:Uncharacterized protein n=1 Tax=Clostridium felsineum TaxID=36839 RepID=A0A1S8KYA0_9CLOT|nr:hypothetical protein [Clostridium felsineum]MCR3759686.1 hypothetical protein [Clostridium felsineum]URZ02535.1 hypothetical protein CLAUR_025470 [Clostridium felsineum]URZ09770.1 hypothetical protein CROST_004630 [Clostridium felsineum]URZ18321.1 hypothetical protein CLFE_043910 [Clostridium felsineum DSM 794]